MGEPDYYRILQVDPRADPEIIEAARNRLSRKYHPDVNTSADAEERMKQINKAYDVLSNPESRARYDRSRGLGGEGTPRPPVRQRFRWLWLAAPAIAGLLLFRLNPRLGFAFMAGWLIYSVVRAFRR
jgi:curved DNA-binding protein CbpA